MTSGHRDEEAPLTKCALIKSPRGMTRSATITTWTTKSRVPCARWTLGALTIAALCVSPHASAKAPEFVFFQESASPEMLASEVRVPLFWDIGGSPAPELLFVSPRGFESLEPDESGALALTQVPTDADIEDAIGPGRVVMALVDLDQEGGDELLIFSRRVSAYRARDGLIEEIAFSPPALPLLSLNDVAVGDLNRDGRADLYLSMGRINWEQIHLSGRPDILWLNQGHGLFQAIEMPRARKALTQGATLVDLNDDGWLDVVESVDSSFIAGPSRILLNTTVAGENTPRFEPSPHTWDSGTEGRGVAVADTNQDGLLDLYASSVGHDLFALGRADGAYEEATFTSGFTHLWTASGPRYQWSPSFVDLNLDGHLDLVARHGAPPKNGDALTTSLAQDLLYLQDASGYFARHATPSPAQVDNGVSMVIGDFKGDGRPDIAVDAHPGGLLLWENISAVPPDTHAFTLRLISRVSASPATGARISALCAGQVVTRHITSGAKMGAQGSTHAHIALPRCTDTESEVRVTFPSGAQVTGMVPRSETFITLTEGAWLRLEDTESVTLDPIAGAAQQACLVEGSAAPQCCSETCTLSVSTSGPLVAALDGHPGITLRGTGPAWLMTSEPALPRPQSTTRFTFQHVERSGPLAVEELSVDVGGVAVPLTLSAPHTLTAQAFIPAPSPTLTVALKRAGKTIASWTEATGYTFSALEPMIDLYPVHLSEPGFAQSAWEAMVHLDIPALLPEAIERITLSDPNGAPIPRSVSFDEGSPRRVRVRVPWEALSETSGLWLYDHEGALGVDLPVRQPTSDEALLATLSHATCGLRRPRMRAGRDMSPGVLTLYSQEGHRMWVPPRLLELEVIGGRLDVPLVLKSPMRDLLFVVGSVPEAGAGEVVVRDIDGRELGRCAFTREARTSRSDALTHHTLSLSPEVIDLDEGETSRLELSLYDAFGELLGADAWPDLLVSGGDFATPLYLSENGHFIADIEADPEADEVRINVVVEGKILETRALPLVGIGPPGASPSGALEDTDNNASGCSSSQGHTHSFALMLLVGLLALLRTKRARQS